MHSESTLSGVDIVHPMIHVPFCKIDLGKGNVDVRTKNIEVWFRQIDFAKGKIDVPKKKIDVAKKNIDVPKKKIDVPQTLIVVRKTKIDVTKKNMRSARLPVSCDASSDRVSQGRDSHRSAANSTRRFFAFPSGVLLSATGRVAP